MVAGSYNSGIHRGYSSGSYGSLNPDTYKGIKIIKFDSQKYISSKKTELYFQTTNTIPSTLKIKINDTVYNFTKNGDSWTYYGLIFSSGLTYTIDFLN